MVVYRSIKRRIRIIGVNSGGIGSFGLCREENWTRTHLLGGEVVLMKVEIKAWWWCCTLKIAANESTLNVKHSYIACLEGGVL